VDLATKKLTDVGLDSFASCGLWLNMTLEISDNGLHEGTLLGLQNMRRPSIKYALLYVGCAVLYVVYTDKYISVFIYLGM
jgi:hypothetical protein